MTIQKLRFMKKSNLSKANVTHDSIDRFCHLENHGTAAYVSH